MSDSTPRPDDEVPRDAVLVWNGMVARLPALVVRPTSAEEIAAAVRYARDHGLPLRITAGDADADGPSMERAVTIDLSPRRAPDGAS